MIYFKYVGFALVESDRYTHLFEGPGHVYKISKAYKLNLTISACKLL